MAYRLRRRTLIAAGLAAMFVGAVVQMPISFLLRQSPLAEHGISWQQARGTLWAGQVTDIAFGARPIGTVELKTDAAGLLLGQLRSDIHWAGVAGSGDAGLMVRRSGYTLRDGHAEIHIAQLAAADPAIRRAGGTLLLQDIAITFGGKGCQDASGRARLDTVQRLGSPFDRDWPLLEGPVECRGTDLVVPLSGQAASGEVFGVTLSISASRLALDAAVSGADPQTRALLSAAGFVPNGADMILTQTAALN